MSKPRPKTLYELVDWLRQEPGMAVLADELDSLLDELNGLPILPSLKAAIPGMSRDRRAQQQRSRAAHSTNAKRVAWHGDCLAQARALLAKGKPASSLSSILAKRSFGGKLRDVKTIRTLLQDAGILKRKMGTR